ncbi:hypothetical protein F4703DRAFT_1731243, partial [Phycomyces blakesleeanus]
LDETNLANFGSDLEHAQRKEEAELEEVWSYEGTPIGNETGMFIWRVQNFGLVRVPEKQYGQFYQGDSYILLKTTTKPGSDSLVHHIHFWLGNETSQHREIQNRESSLFKSYFPSLTYLQGGFESGFNHVEDEELPTRLLRVLRPSRLENSRTHNAVVISQVSLSYESLSSQAQGSGGENIFFEKLGSSGPIEEHEAEIEQEEEEEEKEEVTKQLMCLSSSGPFGLGHLHFDLVAKDTITRDMFDSQHVYVFDVGHQVYTWIGKQAGRKERKRGLQYAQDYIKHSGKSPFTPICRVMEGAEDELFESSLEGWQGW